MLPVDNRWKFADNIPYSWMKVLVDKLRPLAYPALAGPTLMVYSDYSGSTRDSRFETISFLFVDLAAARMWDGMRREVRARFLPDYRRMGFKGLNDSHKRNALPWFLRAADHLHGFCCVIAVEKRVGKMCIREEMIPAITSGGILQSQWGGKSLERMLRVVNFLGILMAILTHPGQSIFWISDEDEMFANPVKALDTKRMLECFTTAYIRHPLGEVGLGTTTIDEEDRFDEDCAAIPDLVAGSTAELVTSLVQEHGTLPDVPVQLQSLSRKSEIVTDWFFSSRSSLAKCGILCSFKGQGHYQIGTWTLDDSLIERPPGIWMPLSK